MTVAHNNKIEAESLTHVEAKALRIIHLTNMNPMGASRKAVDGLIQKGFCSRRNRSLTYSKLTDEGYNALLKYLEQNKE